MTSTGKIIEIEFIYFYKPDSSGDVLTFDEVEFSINGELSNSFRNTGRALRCLSYFIKGLKVAGAKYTVKHTSKIRQD